MNINPKGVASRVFKLTKNYQDAEDAVQSAYLYQLTHRLKRKHFIWKALHEAKDAHRKSPPFVYGQDFDGETPSCFSEIEAKDAYHKLHKSLTPPNQRLLEALLQNGASSTEAAAATGIPCAHFKTLIRRLRIGDIG